jgi:hypothetical protein
MFPKRLDLRSAHRLRPGEGWAYCAPGTPSAAPGPGPGCQAFRGIEPADRLTSGRDRVLVGEGWRELAGFDLAGHQRDNESALYQGLARRAVRPRPRYVNLVRFRPR